jgi:hypothetical protein
MRSLPLALALLLCAGPASGSRFAPLDGRILVLAGQSPHATLAYRELANTPWPAGFSDYVGYDVGAPYKPFAPDAPRAFTGNDGLLEATNWGSGDQCVACLLALPGFAQAVINIGLYLAGPESEDGAMCSARDDCAIARLARGEFDLQLRVLAEWLNGLEGRPVLLRVGYEFDGSWNNYDADQFKAGWKYLYRYLAEAGVSNVAFVYHSYGFATRETLEKFWPGADAYSDSYVDWIGYSYFQLDPVVVGRAELQFARERGLKVFLGEVAPHTGDCTRQIDLSQDIELGRQWMKNFFHHVESNRDVIRAIAYINEHWSDSERAPQWQDQQDQNCGGFFSRSNSRLNDSPALEKYWADRIGSDLYLNLEPDLYRKLAEGAD